MQVRKAARRSSRARIAIIGPSGSGKTLSSLFLAYGLVGDWEKIGVIDTEQRSADLYAGVVIAGTQIGEFLKVDLDPPYSPQKYIAAIEALEASGVQAIVIDSLSHAWAGEGGLLDMHSAFEQKEKNRFAAWRHVTPQHNRLVEKMLSSPAHVVATMRAKTEYAIEKDEKGQTSIRKVGLAPIQRDGIEYEFTIVFDLDIGHRATISKDRTGLLDGRIFVPDPKIGREIREWLESGPNEAPAAPPPPEAPEETRETGLFRVISVNRAAKGDGTPYAMVRLQKEGEENVLTALAHGPMMEVEKAVGKDVRAVLIRNGRWTVIKEASVVETPSISDESVDDLEPYRIVGIESAATPQGTPYARLTLVDEDGQQIVALARDGAYAAIKEHDLRAGMMIHARIKEVNGFNRIEGIAVRHPEEVGANG